MMTSGARHSGHPLVAGEAAGTALVLEQPLSYAGGIERTSGRIEDIHSPHLGTSVTSRIVVMPIGRGSSSASATFAEAIRLGTAPQAIVLPGIDQILAVGAIVARTLYGRVCPVLVVSETDHQAIATGDRVTIWKDGSFDVVSQPPAPQSASGAERRPGVGLRSTRAKSPETPPGGRV